MNNHLVTNQQNENSTDTKWRLTINKQINDIIHQNHENDHICQNYEYVKNINNRPIPIDQKYGCVANTKKWCCLYFKWK